MQGGAAGSAADQDPWAARPTSTPSAPATPAAGPHPAAPPYPAPQPTVGAPSPAAGYAPYRTLNGDPMWGKERDFVIGALLTVVTIGVYHFYYHFKVHDELCQQLGVENRAKTWFWTYFGITVGLLVTTLLFVPLLGLLTLIGFIPLVMEQYRVVHEARRRLGLQQRGDATWFLLWDILGSFILVGPFIAYYNMVENHNDIWRALHMGHRLDAARPMAPPLPPPTPQFPPPGHGLTSDAGHAGHAGHAGQAPAAPGFSIRDRARAPEHQVRQAFRCPNCQDPVEALGAPGAEVALRCGHCGEGGTVRLAEPNG